MKAYWLSLVVFFPVLGALLILFLPAGAVERIRRVALVTSLVEFALALPLYFWFNPASAGMQFLEARVWIPSPLILYQVGLDGLSLVLVLLTAFLTPLAVLTSWPITKRVKEFFLMRSEEHTSELQSQSNLVCRLLLEKKTKARQPHGRSTSRLNSPARSRA